MTRIIAGSAGSTRLRVPEKGTRPTSDRVREAIFSRLEAWDFITGLNFLDLYAGSGALGLEALSRGARHAVLVEKHHGAAAVATANSKTVLRALAANSTAPLPVCNVVTAKVDTWLADPSPKLLFDVVFIDPPYDFSEETITANLSALLPHLAANAVVMLERDKRSPAPVLPEGFQLLQHKVYGETSCWWLETVTDNPA